MNNKGQDTTVWKDTWSKVSIESEIRMWDFFGGRPWIVKYTPRNGKVLEAGCGLGRYNFYLSHLGIDMIGLDFSKETIALLNQWKEQNGYTTPFIEGDVTALPFDDNSLSGYISLGVVEHFIEGPHRPLLEAFRVLRPGGIAIITTPNHTWSKNTRKTISKIKQFVKRIIGREIKKKEFFQYEYSPRQLKKFVEKAGLKVTNYTGTDFLYTFTEFGIREKGRPVTLPFFFQFSKWIDNSFLKNFGAQSVTISIKTAEKMHCFLCDDLSAGMQSLNKYNVPICSTCQKKDLAKHYLRSTKTYYHRNYSINPPLLESQQRKCEFCDTNYFTHSLFEDFGFCRNVCKSCLNRKEVNIELSAGHLKPIWRAKAK